MSDLTLSLIDFALIYNGERPRDSFRRSVLLAQKAEELGFHRIWYAEHHNMPSIASSAPAVLISHIAAQTSHIHLGAGGVMLPNHSPLVVAEQFGTLAELYPGRIDLGLGRAPGTDQRTLRALRRDNGAADRFPDDVIELQNYLAQRSPDEPAPVIRAIPGENTTVPLYILGSSLFGAQLAAMLGLPYAFASHFAPDALEQAVEVYKTTFKPSALYDKPYLVAAVNVTTAESEEIAFQEQKEVLRKRTLSLIGPAARNRTFSEQELDLMLDSPAGRQARHMLKYWALGTENQVSSYLHDFAERVGADELMISLNSSSHDSMLKNMDLTAHAMNLVGAAHSSAQ